MGASVPLDGDTYNRGVSNPLLLLIHSPLVGPSSWRPLEEAAKDRGFDVRRPNLTSVSETPSPRWRHFVDLASQAASDHSDVVLVGHSGAGALLPQIAERVGTRLQSAIFVDAIVPPIEGAHATSQEFLSFLDGKAVNGMLPKWIDWWPPEAIEGMVPNRQDRNELRRDMPRLPRSFFDETVPVPKGWSARPCAYLQLSPAYQHAYDEAQRRGWKHALIDGTHLSIFTDPIAVLSTIEGLVDQLDRN